MKKNKKLVILALFVLVFTSACSTGSDEKVSLNDNKNSAFRRPDFGQPEEKSDIMGLVKSIIGNEVTILKIDRPEKNNENGEKKESEDEEKSQTTQRGVSTGRIPGMGGGMRSSFGGGDSDQQSQMIEAMKKMSTGEEKVIIPVGIRMLKRNEESTEKLDMIEASLADIKQDQMLQIWLDDNSPEQKIANFVMVAR